MRQIVPLVSFAVLSSVCAFGAVTMKKVGEYDFGVDGCGGITYAGGSRFYVLQDHDDTTGKAAVYPYDLTWDSATGAILSQTKGSAVTPGDNADSEGIAFDPGAGTLWISDEAMPTIREFYPYGMQTARAEAPVNALQVTQKRDNRSLEALTISGDGLTMWTANEQALLCDGDASDGNTTVQTVVRLCRFTRQTLAGDWAAAGEWAYQCDTCAGTTSAQSGLSGLCALPDGSLLTLEREVSINTSGRCRIYRVTPSALQAATDVSGFAALANASYSPVEKGSALVNFNNSAESGLFTYNMIVYEGICLGPRLSDGSLAVYLVSDGGATKSQSIATAYTKSRLCVLKLNGLDVHTLDFTAPTTGERPSRTGTNFRYLTGTEIAVDLEGAGLASGAYTNRGARVATWRLTGSGRSGAGTHAAFSVVSDDTLEWTISVSSAETPIVGCDTFEEYAAGKSSAEIDGWSANGEVVAETYAAPSVGTPMQKATHEKVLSVAGGISRTYSETDDAHQQVDMMVKVVRPVEDADIDASAHQGGVAVFADGRFRVFHATADGKPTASVASETVFADGDWVRVTMAFDYAASAPNFTLRLNGAYCGTYPCVGQKTCVAGLDILGETALDDVFFTDGEPDFEIAADPSVPSAVPADVKVPCTWLDRYGLAWNTNEADTDGDGLKAWQEYLAGSSPTDATSLFAITDFKVVGDQVAMTFSGDLPRPDLLRIKWCADLGGAQDVVSGEVTREKGVSVWRATVPSSARFFRAYLSD